VIAWLQCKVDAAAAGLAATGSGAYCGLDSTALHRRVPSPALLQRKAVNMATHAVHLKPANQRRRQQKQS
jgi:hypothetical protein